MKIYAVVVTYNPEPELLDKQYQSLVPQVDKIVYIDNASSNGRPYIEKGCHKAEFIVNCENMGLGYAQNQGIRVAVEEGADFVILFDQDSVPSDGLVGELYSVYNEAQKDMKVALTGPAIMNAYSDNTALEPGVLLKKNGTVARIPLKRITRVSYCIASGSFIPVKVLDEVGYIQERLFVDALDLEWCLRAQSRGYSIVQTNSAYIMHRLGNGSNDKILSHTPQREYFIVRNNIWLSRQPYIPAGYRCRKRLSTIYRLLCSLVRGKGDYLKKQLKGVADGIRL